MSPRFSHYFSISTGRFHLLDGLLHQPVGSELGYRTELEAMMAKAEFMMPAQPDAAPSWRYERPTSRIYRKLENDGLHWPRHDGLKWPYSRRLLLALMFPHCPRIATLAPGRQSSRM